MKIKYLIKAASLCMALALASCGGSSTGIPTASTPTAPLADPTLPAGSPVNTVVTPNTGSMTINTSPNNVVSIGASGTNFKAADATGKAVFTGLTPGAVDVHVFTADGYTATSYYAVNSDLLNDTTGAAGSFVDVYTTVTNAITPNFSFVRDNGQLYGGRYDAATNIFSIQIRDQPAATTISGILYAMSGAMISSAGNAGLGYAEVVSMGQVSFTTLAAAGGATQGAFSASFTGATAPTLVTIQAVTPPAVMPVEILQLNRAAPAAFTTAFAKTGLVFPDTIGAAALPELKGWWVRAKAASGALWTKEGTYAPGDNFSITATMTAGPTIAANQAGDVISWIESADTHVINKVTFNNGFGAGTYTWVINTPSGTPNVTLPAIPSTVTNPIPTGTVGTIKVLSSNTANVSYNQTLAASIFIGLSTEDMTSASVAYTR
ncbi:MAG: hypothetical protein Q9N62_07955 [Ghiorsea sp.]|nr:hypothetical protein [Ghiorsea sp.]